jgi:IS1 family transposase
MREMRMMSLLLFPLRTSEVQLDEKWSFVASKTEKQQTQSPATGENWDHVAIDPEHRLVLAIIPGKRTAENTVKIIVEVKERTGGRTDLLITTDEYPSYHVAIKEVYGVLVIPTGKRGRPAGPETQMPPDLCYATVRKERENFRVVKVNRTIVFGSENLLEERLAQSKASNKINTSFVERNNGTDRGRNSRKRRKTYCFSKDWDTHNASSLFVGLSYNYCWPVRTLQMKNEGGISTKRTPAMAAGLADHVWPISEWMTYPARKVSIMNGDNIIDSSTRDTRPIYKLS